MSKQQTENERAPMCKVCEHRHWNREPHNFKKPAKTAAPAKKKR